MAFLRPTLKDVAKLSGVSEISVSRVMRNAPNISSRLREKVEAAALELHYTPNKVAGALASNTTDLIGVMVPTLEKIEYTKMLSSVESVLAKSKYQMMLGVSNDSVKQETKIISDFLAWSPSGIIMIDSDGSELANHLLERSGTLRVGILNEAKNDKDHALGVSYEQAVTALVSSWVKRGFKSIVYVSTNEAYR